MALLLILLEYLVIGVLAAGGAIAFGARRLTPRQEQVCYGLLLVPIAAMYLAFLAYLSPAASLRAELPPVLGFVALGLAGTRFTPLLILGYAAHGAWDLAHEILMYQGRLGGFTAIPLAYGVFCATFDWILSAYFWTRRNAWKSA